MNEDTSRDGSALLGVFFGLLCLVMATYFLLMGLLNYLPRERNVGLGSFGIAMSGVCIWGVYRCVRWGFRKHGKAEMK